MEARTRTDAKIPSKLFWAAAASYATWTGLAIFRFISREEFLNIRPIVTGILGVAGFGFAIITAYLVYCLTSRRNNHFAREENLLRITIQDERAKASNDLKILYPLDSAEHGLQQLTRLGRERSAMLWALLTVIPYVGWLALIYVLAFLSNDMSKHERQEETVLEDLARVMARTGSVMPMKIRRMPRPSVPLYIIFSFLTAGIFPLLWLYLVMKDPEIHFEFHRSFEAYFAQSIMVGAGATE